MDSKKKYHELSLSRKRETRGQSQLERLHDEAREILTQKQQQIDKLNSAIDETEKELSSLKHQIRDKNQEIQELESNKTSQNLSQYNEEIEDLIAQQEAELDSIKSKHEDEMQELRSQFERSLQEAEQWSNQHAETIYLEKSAQLDELRQELEVVRAQTAQTAFSATKQRTKLYQQSRNASLANSQRIQHLESQLSELTSITREEVRDVKAKIEECLVAVEIREHEHATEIAKYERELQQREQKYNAHLASLQDQFTSEKARLEQQIEAANKKTEGMNRLLRQLEKQQSAQLESTLRDIEKMKTTIYQSKTQADQQLQTSRAQISAIQNMQREYHEKEQELGLINAEIKELEVENRDLQAELRRLDTNVYGQTNI